MKKHNKILLTIVCAVLLVVTSVLGTLAYLTSQDSVVNTFTVGKVNIELHETGEQTRDNGTVGKDYHLLPGQSYEKDPTVTVLADSDNAYVRMIVTVSNYADLKAAFPENQYPDYYDANDNFLLQHLVTDWEPAKWECVGISEVDATGVYEFRYFEPVSTANGPAKVLEPLFTNVVIPGKIDNAHLAELQNMQITVVAHAIQAAGFDTAELAWAAFATQHP